MFSRFLIYQKMNANNQIKTGSYAVTTVYSMPWAKKETPTIEKTVKKKLEKKIVHPIFEECEKITDDKYWISIMHNCARDKFPRGFFFKNGQLTHRRGNKTKRVLVTDSPIEALSICISFFKTTAGLMSDTDRHRIQKEEEQRLLENMSNENLEWKNIKIERIKEILISEFVKDITDRTNMNIEQRDQLLTTVRVGFMLKYFASKHIIMHDGKITKIEGLLYDEENKKYYIDSAAISKKASKKPTGLGIERKIPKYIPYSKLWEKYLLNLEKRNDINSNFHIIDNNGFSINDKTPSYDSNTTLNTPININYNYTSDDTGDYTPGGSI
jgi:hypothetical protein